MTSIFCPLPPQQSDPMTFCIMSTSWLAQCTQPQLPALQGFDCTTERFTSPERCLNCQCTKVWERKAYAKTHNFSLWSLVSPTAISSSITDILTILIKLVERPYTLLQETVLILITNMIWISTVECSHIHQRYLRLEKFYSLLSLTLTPPHFPSLPRLPLPLV